MKVDWKSKISKEYLMIKREAKEANMEVNNEVVFNEGIWKTLKEKKVGRKVTYSKKRMQSEVYLL